MLAALAFVCACHSRPREAKTPDPSPETLDPLTYERYGWWGEAPEPPRPHCIAPRPVTAWGPAPRTGPPDIHCPIKVRVSEAGLSVETFDPFDPHPRREDVPSKYRVGSRRVFRVDDGWLVAYAGAFDGEAYWTSEEGEERRPISRARLVGFARAPSGTILALGVGQARLGRGGVVALDHTGRGEYAPRLVATLPLEPSAVAFEDEGRLLTFVQGFVVRIDEEGKVENVHYVAHDVGRVASIARAPSGEVFLGLECGVLKLTSSGPPHFSHEEFWSARTGASGQWSACETAPTIDTRQW